MSWRCRSCGAVRAKVAQESVFEPDTGISPCCRGRVLVPHDRTDAPVDDVRDLGLGLDLKAEGQAAVLAVTDDEWKASFAREVARLAREGSPFTAEDVTEIVGLPPGGRVNAIGAAMNGAAKKLGLRRIDSAMATRSLRHASRIAVWQGVVDHRDPGRPCATCGAQPVGAYRDGSPLYPSTCRHEPIRALR